MTCTKFFKAFALDSSLVPSDIASKKSSLGSSIYLCLYDMRCHELSHHASMILSIEEERVLCFFCGLGLQL